MKWKPRCPRCDGTDLAEIASKEEAEGHEFVKANRECNFCHERFRVYLPSMTVLVPLEEPA